MHEFPYTNYSPHQPNKYAIIFSKIPFNDTLESKGYTYVSMTIETGTINLYGVHASAPLSNMLFISRNEILGTLNQRVQQQPSRTILIGDLNTTPWSPFYRQISQNTPLINYTLDRIHFTWFAYNLPLLPSHLDHALTTPDIQVSSCEVKNFPGSDHHALIMKFN